MTSWAVVAIPRKDDYVWRISSEKVPHMTILFLGEQPDSTPTDKIAEFLQHAADVSLTQFGMDVMKRGELGPNDADVIFFNKRWNKTIENFRSNLLQDQMINSLWMSVEDQYPEWTPHLTLGYPETPAKVDERDYPGITWVNFDRVALWTGDYEGPEFELKSYEDQMELAMDDPMVEYLAHYGIKGMKWGVRRSKIELAKKRTKDSSDFTTSRKLKSNPRRTLSNKEMQTVIKRLEMEKKLKDLDPSIAGKGEKALKRTLTVVGTVTALAAAAKSPAGKAAAGGVKTAASTVRKKVGF